VGDEGGRLGRRYPGQLEDAGEVAGEGLDAQRGEGMGWAEAVAFEVEEVQGRFLCQG